MLIVGMICCLVFFLVTVLYSGNFTIRLMYIFGLYTFASVFTARIAIEQSRTVAAIYASILGCATLVVTMRFVQFSGSLAPFSIPATIGFLALIAFLADRITYDCTLIDESSDGVSEGLLQTLGLVPSGLHTKSREQGPTDRIMPGLVSTPGLQDRTGNSIDTVAKSKAGKKKHNPGVWVLYFALLAIPLFGLGQIMIPSWDRVRNQLAFVFLVGYLYCTLSLLVVTSLLSLRRYLRRRQIEMPLDITAVWFLSGIFGIVGILGVLSFISLPSGNTGLLTLPFTITSPDGMKASPNGWGPEGVPTENPKANADQDDPTGKVAQQAKQNDAPKQNPTGNADSKNNSEGANESQANPGESGNAKNGESKDGSPSKSGSQSDKNQPNNESKGDPSKQNAGKDQSPENPPSSPQKTSEEDLSNKNEKPPNQQQKSQPQQDKRNESEPQSKPEQMSENAPEKGAGQTAEQPAEQKVEKKAAQAKDEQAQKPNEEPASKPDVPQQSNTPSSWSIALTGGITDLLRWLLMVSLAIFVLYCAIRYRADLATAWRKFLQTLFGFLNIRRPPRPESFEDTERNPIALQTRKTAFNDFADPFQQSQSQWAPPKIVSHTFQAIEAWGSERNLPRTSNETAEEYLTRLAIRYPIQSESFQRLTGLYNRLAYAAKSVDSSESNKLAGLWSWLRKTADQ